MNSFLRTVLIFGALVTALPGDALAGKYVPASREQIRLSYAPLVRKASPAVVNIYTKKVVRTRQMAPLFDDPFFRRFFGKEFGRSLGRTRKKVQNSLGSGVIIDAGGLIVTNHHVIEGADEIRVVLADRREFGAKIVGTDERTDLTVLRILAGGEALPFLDIRDSDELEVGDLVLAIGNPFGVGQTVTSGIVSALARTQTGISDIGSFIQTDAAINPGNSGGALIGMDGRLVGINTAIFSKSGGSLGIGFATPSNMVRSVVAGLTSTGRVVRPWLGASGQTITNDLAVSLGLKRPAGVLVSEVYEGGSAQTAGLSVGDVVLEVNGRGVDTPDDLRYRLATLPIGERAEFTIWRLGNKRTLSAVLTPPPEIPPRDEMELSGNHPLQGAIVANMSPALADDMGLDDFTAGVVVLKKRRGSNAARMRLRVGDRIKAVNGTGVESVRHLENLLSKRGNGWRIAIRRGKKSLELVVKR